MRVRVLGTVYSCSYIQIGECMSQDWCVCGEGGGGRGIGRDSTPMRRQLEAQLGFVSGPGSLVKEGHTITHYAIKKEI